MVKRRSFEKTQLAAICRLIVFNVCVSLALWLLGAFATAGTSMVLAADSADDAAGAAGVTGVASMADVAGVAGAAGVGGVTGGTGEARTAGATPATYVNPVLDVGGADPHVIKASDGRYYMYNTFGFAIHVSDDLVNWRRAGSAMPAGSWGVADFWAPAVIEHEGRFYLYYSAERREGGKRIGVAVSDHPTGPFRDLGKPLFDPGYPVIDAHPFIDDDGKAYLYFSQDQVPQGPGRYESRIYGVELGPDLMSVVGEPVLLTKPQQAWERRSGGRLWNEGPFLFKHDGTYYLMYSANCFCGMDYSVGYATSHHPLGPYTKYPGNPILSRGTWLGRISGPGHHSVVPSPDGREWWIVYHIHADPAIGGGDRRIAVDRMGVREDGSLFVSGPTLTPQPLPSGADELVNLAPFARVTASSVKVGRTAAALVDGEFAIDPEKEGWEWAAAGEREGAWIRLEWSREQRARWIYLYPSVMASRRAATVTVRASDGREIAGVRLPETPGAAAMVELGDDRGFTWLEIRVDEMAGAAEAGMAEVMVLGYRGGLPDDRSGSVWISSPRRGDLVRGSAPLRVEAHHVDVDHVLVQLDGEIVYAGDRLPEGLEIRPAELLPGAHELTAVVTDVDGRELRYTSVFQVEHVRVLEPLEGEWLRGQALMRLEAWLPEDEIADVRVDWVPIGATAEVAEVETIYRGSSVPAEIVLDTPGIPDGAYDLQLHLTTAAGVVSTRAIRVVVNNWEILEDPLPPPRESWFGLLSQLKTVDASEGWAHVADDPELYLGDADRMVPTGKASEHLTWRLPRLHDFEVSVYVADRAHLDSVSVWVSADGADWTKVWYNVAPLSRSDEAPFGFLVTGVVPPELSAEYVKVVVEAGEIPPGEIQLQLAHVRLRGIAGERTRS